MFRCSNSFFLGGNAHSSMQLFYKLANFVRSLLYVFIITAFMTATVRCNGGGSIFISSVQIYTKDLFRKKVKNDGDQHFCFLVMHFCQGIFDS